MNWNRTLWAATTLVLAFGVDVVTRARPAAAQGAPPSAAEFARLQAEVARLQQDVREQKQLLLNMMQADQQRYDVLLQLVRSLGPAGAAVNVPSMPALPPSVTGGARPPAPGSEEASAAQVGTISGKVTMPAGIGGAYVYVDGLRGGPARARTVEIQQKDKQFSPPSVVVPVGSKLVFPNVDTVFHNVFSVTPGLAFDTGSIKGGDRSRPVALSKSGHLEIFCNIHRKMRADVLVVPNGYFTKVGNDGSFELPGIPLGTRKVVVWAPGIKPAAQQVEITPKGATVRLAPQADPAKPHLNKNGQVYGSYDD